MSNKKSNRENRLLFLFFFGFLKFASAATACAFSGAGRAVGTADTFLPCFLLLNYISNGKTHNNNYNQNRYNVLAHILHLNSFLGFYSLDFSVSLGNQNSNNRHEYTDYRKAEDVHPSRTKVCACKESAKEVYEESERVSYA